METAAPVEIRRPWRFCASASPMPSRRERAAAARRRSSCARTPSSRSARRCATTPTLQYNFLSTITAVDWLEREPRYDMVYHLMSLGDPARCRGSRFSVGDDDSHEPEAPS